MNADVRFAPRRVCPLTDPQGAARRPQGGRHALVVALVALSAHGVSDVPQRPSEVSGRQLCLELLDGPNADAVNLR
jgi:hypothetical protein